MTQSNLDPLIQQIQNQQLEQIRAKRPVTQDSRSKIIGAEAGLTKVRDAQGNIHWASTNGNTGGIDGVAPELTRDAIAVPQVRPFDEPRKDPCCVISPQRKPEGNCRYIWLLGVDLNHYGTRPRTETTPADLQTRTQRTLVSFREAMGQAFWYRVGGSAFHRNNQIVTDQPNWLDLMPDPRFVVTNGESYAAIPDIGYSSFVINPYFGSDGEKPARDALVYNPTFDIYERGPSTYTQYNDYGLFAGMSIENGNIVVRTKMTRRKIVDSPTSTQSWIQYQINEFTFSKDLELIRSSSEGIFDNAIDGVASYAGIPDIRNDWQRLKGGFFGKVGLSGITPYQPRDVGGNSLQYIQGDPLSSSPAYFLLAKDSELEKVYGSNKTTWPNSVVYDYTVGKNSVRELLIAADSDAYVQSEMQQRILNDLSTLTRYRKAWSVNLHEAWFVISDDGKRETTRKIFQALGYPAVPQFPGLPDEELLYPVSTFDIVPSCIHGSNIGQSLHPITQAPIPRGFTKMPSIIQNMEIFGLLDLAALNSLGVEPWQ